MSTRSSRGSGRGGAPRWLVLLGVALVVGGVAVPQVSTRVHDRQVAEQAQSVRARLATSEATRLPFVVEPSVRFEKAKLAQPVEKPAAAAGVPLRLVVPKLRVDAPVVGISSTDGVLLPPGDPQTLGWWSGGARPGAVHGGALITGHTVHTGGGAFDNLEALRAGDEVRVRTRGGVLRYVVSGVTIYRKASLAKDAQRVFSQSVPGRLVLVTCEDWNGRIYLSNAVVFADRVTRG